MSDDCMMVLNQVALCRLSHNRPLNLPDWKPYLSQTAALQHIYIYIYNVYSKCVFKTSHEPGNRNANLGQEAFSQASLPKQANTVVPAFSSQLTQPLQGSTGAGSTNSWAFHIAQMSRFLGKNGSRLLHYTFVSFPCRRTAHLPIHLPIEFCG